MQRRWLREQWAVALISWTEGSEPGERAEVRQSPVAQQQNTPYNCERSPAQPPITNKKNRFNPRLYCGVTFFFFFPRRYHVNYVTWWLETNEQKGTEVSRVREQKASLCASTYRDSALKTHAHTAHTRPESMLVGRGSGGGARGDGTKPVWNTNTEHLWAISTWLRLLHGYGWSIQDSWVLQLSEFLFSHEWIDGSRYNEEIKWDSCASWHSIHSFSPEYICCIVGNRIYLLKKQQQLMIWSWFHFQNTF